MKAENEQESLSDLHLYGMAEDIVERAAKEIDIFSKKYGMDPNAIMISYCDYEVLWSARHVSNIANATEYQVGMSPQQLSLLGLALYKSNDIIFPCAVMM